MEHHLLLTPACLVVIHPVGNKSISRPVGQWILTYQLSTNKAFGNHLFTGKRGWTQVAIFRIIIKYQKSSSPWIWDPQLVPGMTFQKKPFVHYRTQRSRAVSVGPGIQALSTPESVFQWPCFTYKMHQSMLGFQLNPTCSSKWLTNWQGKKTSVIQEEWDFKTVTDEAAPKGLVKTPSVADATCFFDVFGWHVWLLVEGGFATRNCSSKFRSQKKSRVWD